MLLLHGMDGKGRRVVAGTICAGGVGRTGGSESFECEHNRIDE
jgi:hypothetical protein